jgi:hypothetical protein
MNPTPDNLMLEPLDVSELKRLMAALSDGQLQPADHERLELLLRTHRDARSMYMAYMQIDSGLDWKIRGRQSVRGLADLSKQCSSVVAPAQPRSSVRPVARLRSQRVFLGAALAASLVFVLASIVWMMSPKTEDTVAESDPINRSSIAKIVKLSDESTWFMENRRNGDDSVLVGDKVRLTRGQLRMEFDCGATVTMKSPAVLEVVSPTRTRAVLGTLTAHVEKGAEGFTVETPRTTVVDLGTDFGIDVSDHGSTDVVVFTGAVDVHSDGVEGLGARQRLKAGEGVRVSGEGTASRIVSIDDSQFSITTGAEPRHRTPVISAVSDNISRGESWYYYEVVHGGMREDARAFVDRPHEWNGVKGHGMPSYLLGADYVKTFNDDKLNQRVEIRVTLERPAILYVLLDKRSPPPNWLREKFYNTYDEVGLDGGGYKRFGIGAEKTVEIGAGKSVDDTFSIWRLDVPAAGTVKLGAMQSGSQYHNMYAIAAVPLEIHNSRDDFADSREQSRDKVHELQSDEAGVRTTDGTIERPADVDVFTLDWSGGVAEIACLTSGLTTLDPMLRVYDANAALVGYAQAKPGNRERTSVTMNLPKGLYYVEVAGSKELGDVGTYQVQVSPTSGELPLPMTSDPTLALTAAPSEVGTALAWEALPTARSYTIETSSDAVSFQPIITTTEIRAVDEDLQSGVVQIYRLRADTNAGQLVGPPIVVRGNSASVERLAALGLSSKSVVLEWSSAADGEGYRIERSSDGQQFETIGSAAQHANGYRDSDVQPGQRYFYRVATLNSGGSDAFSKPVQALSGVADVTAEAVVSNRVEISWTSDYPEARYYVQRAANNRGQFVTVGAVDGNVQSFVDQTAVPGSKLRYRVVAVEDVSKWDHVTEGSIDTIRLPDGAEDDDYFGLRIEGKLRIDKAGQYTFFLNSDDGSKLYLDGSLVIDNDGQHAPLNVAGTVWLAAGYHDLEVQYFQIDGRRALDLSWNGPGPRHPTIAHFKLPDPYLSDLTYRYFEGNWQQMPFEQIVAVSPIVSVSTPLTSDEIESH